MVTQSVGGPGVMWSRWYKGYVEKVFAPIAGAPRLCDNSINTASVQLARRREGSSGQHMGLAAICSGPGCQAASQTRAGAMWSCFCEPAYGGPSDWAFGTK
jgi:hypothetical protein